ncbi:hypothetical protein [Lactiplantibacillus brownii]|uniref:hypothetical protein n=1 Tax=Lactiplantibacillus brownii TaxID=3069269 RepID=UPI0038B3EC31
MATLLIGESCCLNNTSNDTENMVHKMKLKSKGNTLMNPFFLFAMAFFVVLILYSLRLSEFNTILEKRLLIFLVVTILLNFILYVVFRKRWAFQINNTVINQNGLSKGYGNISVTFLLLGLAEAIYSHGLPILGQVNYKDYGMPVIHVILVCCDSFYILFLAKNFFNKNVSQRGKIVWNMIISAIPLLFALSRGTIVIILIGIAILFITSRSDRLRTRSSLMIVFLLCMGLYLFGIAGNYRMNHDYMKDENLNQSSLILSIGKANDKFENSKIPAPFFWTYIYTTSPLSNLNMNIQSVSVDSASYTPRRGTEYAVVNFLPDFISKRIYPLYTSEFNPWLVTPEFTASSALVVPYLMLGWVGLYIFMVYELMFPIVYFWLVIKIAPSYFDIAFTLVSTMYLLMPFANFFAFSALSIQLFLPFICAFFRKSKKGLSQITLKE